jgi:Lon protease-like protein
VDSLLPLFPLGTVALPGMTLPLHVFEERYRELVADLLAIPDPQARVFGVVAIREGYEVGPHEARSMYRTGCLMRLVSVERHDDGRYDVVALGQARFRVLGTDTERPYLRAQAQILLERLGAEADEVTTAAMETLATFEDYRTAVSTLRGGAPGTALPSELTALSYALGAETTLPLSERQHLLEAATAIDRLRLMRRHLGAELRAMRAVPSLPATDIARSAWSPN